MTKETYLEMCRLMGSEPDPNKIPPSLDEFPDYVRTAIHLFNVLQDTYTGGMVSIYAGKNITALPVLFDLYSVPDDEKLKTFEVIQYLDDRARTQAIAKAKEKSSRAG